MVFPSHVRAFRAGNDIPAFKPETQGTKLHPGYSSSDLTSQFKLLRGECLTLLEQLRDPDLSRSARHAELGQVTLNEMLHEWRPMLRSCIAPFSMLYCPRMPGNLWF
jgi:hypothetical protein